MDVDFVRRSVRAIGRCAISLERAAERCINVLIELIHTKVNYVVQEAIIVIKDIFRRYPNRWEPVLPVTNFLPMLGTWPGMQVTLGCGQQVELGLTGSVTSLLCFSPPCSLAYN